MNRGTLLPLIAQPKVDVAAIDEKVLRILRTIAAGGFLDHPQRRDDIPLDDPASAATALDAARKGIVLLKNAGGLCRSIGPRSSASRSSGPTPIRP